MNGLGMTYEYTGKHDSAFIWYLKEHPEINFSVEGHTDNDGDDVFNQQLSEERAAAVAVTLANMGMYAGSLVSKGWGESKPLDTNNTPEGKANNRRIEFVKL